MRVPYGPNHEFFKHSLFLVFCNRITTSAVSAVFLLVSYEHSSTNATFHKISFTTLYILFILSIFLFPSQTSKKALDPVAPVYKYCIVSISNILTTTCQYEVICSFHS